MKPPFEKSERFDARQKSALRLAEAMTWGLDSTDALWEGLKAHLEVPQIVELGFFIGLTMGQQRWNRLLNLQHGSFMGGTTGGLAPAAATAAAQAAQATEKAA